MLTLAYGPSAWGAVNPTVVLAVGGGGVYPIGGSGDPMDFAILISGSPESVAISPDAKTAYVADATSGQLVTVNLGRDRVARRIDVGGVLDAVALSPDGANAYVERPGAIVVVNLRTYLAGHPIPVPVSAPTNVSGQAGLAVSPNGRMAYVSDQTDDTVVPVNLQAGVALAGIAVPSTPNGIVIAPDGLTAYVATASSGAALDPASGTLTPINLTARVAETPVPLPYAATSQVALNRDASTGYVTSESGVIAVDLHAGQVRTVIAPKGATLNSPFAAIAVNASQTTAYAVAPCVDLEVSCFSGVFAFNLKNDSSRLLYSAVPFKTLTGLAIPPSPQAALQAFGSRADSPIHFTTLGSTNPGGRIRSYQWSFGDHASTRTTRSSISHIYRKAGRFTVTLTTHDRGGCASRMIFTGQTATCSGQTTVTATRTVTITHPKTTR